MISVRRCVTQKEWDAYITKNNGHPLQLWGWGQVKAAHNWHASRVFVVKNNTIIGAAQLLIRVLPGGFKSLVYVPRGPVAAQANRAVVLEELAQYARNTFKAIVLTIEPHWKDFAQPKGWVKTNNTILIPRTLIIDLTKTQDELMGAINRKRRYDIRRSTQDVASIHAVTTHKELAECLAIYRHTAQRAGFALHTDSYYYDIFDTLGPACKVTAAYNGAGQVIAFSWLVATKHIAFELYGGSNQEGQKLMANYALKWWVIKQLKKEGIQSYDLNGLMNDGISHFKRSFANHEDMLVGTYDRPLSPLYILWVNGLPLIKKVARALKK